LLGSFLISFSFQSCWASQYHSWVLLLLWFLWQYLSILVNVNINLHPCQELMESVRCYGRWSIPYMLLLKVPEHAYVHCCYSNCSSILFCGMTVAIIQTAPHLRWRVSSWLLFQCGKPNGKLLFWTCRMKVKRIGCPGHFLQEGQWPLLHCFFTSRY
jgi:hypothetical protein